MKKLFLMLIAVTSLVLFLSLSLLAQDEKVANKAIYSELGGPGVLMSANFDSRFFSDSQFGFGYRAGIGFFYGEYDSDRVNRTIYTIPVGLNYVFGKSSSLDALEIGAGVTFLSRKVETFFYDSSDKKPNRAFGFFTFMYRRAPEGSGFSWRVGVTPFINMSGELFPMVVVSIGYIF